MSHLGALIARNRKHLASTERPLIVEPDHRVDLDDARRQLSGCEAFSQFGWWQGSDQVHVGSTPPKGPFDCIVWTMPRERARRAWLAKMLANSLGGEGTLLAIGEVKAGGKSANRELANAFERCVKVDNARHAIVYACRGPQRYGDKLPWSTYDIGDPIDLTIAGLPGVFSDGEMDSGSRALSPFLDRLRGDVLDFGCGAGVLGAIAARHAVSERRAIQLHCCDVYAPAIDACSRTFEINRLPDPKLMLRSGPPAAGSFDAIISNPPFHRGRETSLDASRDLFTNASRLLKRRGQITWVANRFIDYRPLLGDSFRSIETMASNASFVVTRATRR